MNRLLIFAVSMALVHGAACGSKEEAKKAAKADEPAVPKAVPKADEPEVPKAVPKADEPGVPKEAAIDITGVEDIAKGYVAGISARDLDALRELWVSDETLEAIYGKCRPAAAERSRKARDMILLDRRLRKTDKYDRFTFKSAKVVDSGETSKGDGCATYGYAGVEVTYDKHRPGGEVSEKDDGLALVKKDAVWRIAGFDIR